MLLLAMFFQDLSLPVFNRSARSNITTNRRAYAYILESGVQPKAV